VTRPLRFGVQTSLSSDRSTDRSPVRVAAVDDRVPAGTFFTKMPNDADDVAADVRGHV
jgi:hypothetical protein